MFELSARLGKICNSENLLTPEMFIPKPLSNKIFEVRCASSQGIVLKAGCYVKIPLGFNFTISLPPIIPMYDSKILLKHHLQLLTLAIENDEVNMIGFWQPDLCKTLYNADQILYFGEIIGRFKIL